MNIEVLKEEINWLDTALQELNDWDTQDFRNALEGLHDSLADIVYDETIA